MQVLTCNLVQLSKIARRRYGMLLTKDRMLSELIIANDLKDNIMVSQ